MPNVISLSGSFARAILAGAMTMGSTSALAQTALPPVHDLLMPPQLRELAPLVPNLTCLSSMKSRFYANPVYNYHFFADRPINDTSLERDLNARGVNATLFACHLLHELQQPSGTGGKALPIAHPASFEQG